MEIPAYLVQRIDELPPDIRPTATSAIQHVMSRMMANPDSSATVKAENALPNAPAEPKISAEPQAAKSSARHALSMKTRHKK